MQAGLRLCCSQTFEDRFSHVDAHIHYTVSIHINLASQLLAVVSSENMSMLHENEMAMYHVYTSIQIFEVLRSLEMTIFPCKIGIL